MLQKATQNLPLAALSDTSHKEAMLSALRCRPAAMLGSTAIRGARISRRAALGLETFSTQTRTTVAEATARNGVWSHCRLMPSVP